MNISAHIKCKENFIFNQRQKANLLKIYFLSLFMTAVFHNFKDIFKLCACNIKCVRTSQKEMLIKKYISD